MSGLKTTYCQSAQNQKREQTIAVARRLQKLREQALENPYETFTAITPIGVYTVTRLTPALLDRHGIPHDNPHLLGAVVTNGSIGSHKIDGQHHAFFETYKPRQPSPTTPIQALEA